MPQKWTLHFIYGWYGSQGRAWQNKTLMSILKATSSVIVTCREAQSRNPKGNATELISNQGTEPPNLKFFPFYILCGSSDNITDHLLII